MKKRLAVLTAFLMAVSSLSACSSVVGEETTEETTTQTTAAEGYAEDPSAIGADSFSTWKDIDRSAVIAEVTGENASDYFKITFGEFYSEYLYYLLSYGIADDMAADTAEECESYRREIIKYLTFEKQFLYAAEKEFNCGEKQLTEEERAEIKRNSDEVIANWKEGYRDAAIEELGENATEEQLEKKCAEKLNSDLERCELTTDIFYNWELSSYILDKLTEAVSDQVTLERSEAEAMYKDYYDAALEAYNNNVAEYERTPMYNTIYIPEGARKATHIFIPFDDEIADEIADKRLDGLDGEANELRNTAAEGEISDTALEALNKLNLAETAEYETIISEYNPEGAVEYYTVVPETVIYYPEYKEALFSLDTTRNISEPVTCDSGVYIIIYLGEAFNTEEDIEEIKDSMYEFLLAKKKETRQTELIDEWDEKYPFYVNYDLLRITPEEEEITVDYDTVS